jgi:transcription-repair coupling factor (superfamily II helicase)
MAATLASRFKVSGVTPPARAVVLAELTRIHPSPVWLVVAADLKAAEQLAEDLAFFHEATDKSRSQTTLIFPESMPDTRDMREAFAASNDRFTVLSKLRASRNTPHLSDSLVVVTTPAALLQPVPALEEFATREFTLRRGDKQSFQGLLERLQQLDYDSEAVCEAPGHYAIRGGIIDVYPITATAPYRLDFFGDELEEIRVFDPVTQRSAETVENITSSNLRRSITSSARRPGKGRTR